MTATDEFGTAADEFLKELDSLDAGAATGLQPHQSKEWCETYLLRALHKRLAAKHHLARIHAERQASHERAQQALERAKVDHKKEGVSAEVRMSMQLPASVIAFEVEAFLGACRAAVDHLAYLMAHFIAGWQKPRSVTKLLKAAGKADGFPFGSVLEAHGPWINSLKHYRDSLTHWRALRCQGGYEVYVKGGAAGAAVMPVVIPGKPEKDTPDTRATRAVEGANLDWHEQESVLIDDDGEVQHLEWKKGFTPSRGYVDVEEFCSEHLDKLNRLAVDVLSAIRTARFALLTPPKRSGSS